MRLIYLDQRLFEMIGQEIECSINQCIGCIYSISTAFIISNMHAMQFCAKLKIKVCAKLKILHTLSGIITSNCENIIDKNLNFQYVTY